MHTDDDYPTETKIYRCVICNKNEVDPYKGFDTCPDCAIKTHPLPTTDDDC